MFRSFAGFIALALTQPLLAAAQPSAVQMSSAEQAAVQQALDRGTLIYAYDQAAWHGTDDMLAKIENPNEVLGGWIVDGPVNAPELVFYDKDEADPHAVYVAQFMATN